MAGGGGVGGGSPGQNVLHPLPPGQDPDRRFPTPPSSPGSHWTRDSLPPGPGQEIPYPLPLLSLNQITDSFEHITFIIIIITFPRTTYVVGKKRMWGSFTNFHLTAVTRSRHARFQTFFHATSWTLVSESCFRFTFSACFTIKKFHSASISVEKGLFKKTLLHFNKTEYRKSDFLKNCYQNSLEDPGEEVMRWVVNR